MADSVGHEVATEILRMNILSEYGGIFRQMEMYHSEVFEIGMPCDSTIFRSLKEENLPKYSIDIPLEIITSCTEYWNVYNNRFYLGQQLEGRQTATSNLLSLDIKLQDAQDIAGNTSDDMFTYGQWGQRAIQITSGITAEIEPFANLFLFFPSCNYDRENVLITEVAEANFNLSIRSNEILTETFPQPRKEFEGTIKLVNGNWTVFYKDGNVDFF